MRIQKLKTKANKRLTPDQFFSLNIALEDAIKAAGFVSDVDLHARKIGLHMCSFRVDVNKLGYNARVNASTLERTASGYKRTDLPTWGQRIQFNNIVNDVFDRQGIVATIESGNFVVRTAEGGRVKHWAPPAGRFDSVGYSSHSLMEVVPLDKAVAALQTIGICDPWKVCA